MPLKKETFQSCYLKLKLYQIYLNATLNMLHDIFFVKFKMIGIFYSRHRYYLTRQLTQYLKKMGKD